VGLDNRTSRLIFAAALAVVSAPWLAGCGESSDTPLPGRWYTASQVETGRELFRSQCAGCHGLEAQGTADWRRRDADGNLPPPPLNGSAHAWHHSREQLVEYILEGGVPLGGTMPGFAALLQGRQALAVVAFFQSTWDDEIYARWVSMYPPDKRDGG
jgi:mono/diheme cytochrome c family protein